MAGDVLLDTNVVIDEMMGRFAASPSYREADSVYISSVILGELLFGAYNSADPDKHLNLLEDFLLQVEVVELGMATAQEYGQIKLRLRKIGKPIPDNDMWIAATAIEHDLELVSNDQPFANVERLKWMNP